MKVYYEGLTGCDSPWIQMELKQHLRWVETASIGEIFSRIDAELTVFRGKFNGSLMALQTPVRGFRYLVTNSAVTVFPRV